MKKAFFVSGLMALLLMTTMVAAFTASVGGHVAQTVRSDTELMHNACACVRNVYCPAGTTESWCFDEQGERVAVICSR